MNHHDLPIPPLNPDHTLEQTQAHWEKEPGHICQAERTLITQLAATYFRSLAVRADSYADRYWLRTPLAKGVRRWSGRSRPIDLHRAPTVFTA